MEKFALSIVLVLTACSSNSKTDHQSLSQDLSSQSAAEIILNGAKNDNIDDPSRWKSDGNKVIFTGRLRKEDCNLFLKNINDQTDALDVNSSGGDAFAGLCIALEMKKRNFKEVHVNGLCVSSCANYLFLAAEKRIIQNGIVGYHGNISALLKRDPQNKSLRKQLVEAKVIQKEIDRITTQFRLEQKQNAIKELKFLSQIGVSQELFERTQEPDKGLGNGTDYTFLLPTPATFRKYGIQNIIGDQNFELGKLMGMNNLLQ